MPIHYSRHALEEIADRGFPLALQDAVLNDPEQRVEQSDEIVCYHSRLLMNGKQYLLRVMVNETREP